MTRLLAAFFILQSLALAEFQQPAPNVFLWQDTCKVCELKLGARALLINLGAGSVLQHLGEIGVKRVEWVLFTDHHRELCQGAPKLDRTVTQTAAPKDEQAFFETPNEFRKWNPRLGDKFAVHGSSYLRPPAQPLKIDKLLAEGCLLYTSRCV